MSNSLTEVWKSLKAEHGVPVASELLVGYYEEHGVKFAENWDMMQKSQVIATFFESIRTVKGGVVFDVKVGGETLKETVDAVFNALAQSQPVTVPEDFLVYPFSKEEKKQLRKDRYRR